jgi:uncharacterized protein (TIGR03435 family)
LEVIGGPGWIDSDRWNMQAVPPPGTKGTDDVPAMLKALLEERFNFRAHLEQRDRPVYRLVLARSDGRLGPGMMATECHGDASTCGNTSANTSGIRRGTLTVSGNTLAHLATTLSNYVERRVFDATELEGHFNFQLEWSEELSIFTALQEQLGLKLESARGSIDVLVIDQVERPAPD